MGPDGLAALRSFIGKTEPHLPGIVSLMYIRFFEARPDAVLLFKGDLREQQRQFTSMLWSIVRLTRSSELWPINAVTGQAPIPTIEKLGLSHASAGVTPDHFDVLKRVLSQCFREQFPREFTPPVEKALGFVFDVVSRSAFTRKSGPAIGLGPQNRLGKRDI
jgi:hemoglobin-like flavoprotein